mgnify:CR=1 FL=1
MQLELLISPLAKGAYFAQHLEVAAAEFKAHFPQAECRLSGENQLHWLSTSLPECDLRQLSRLSFVQGIFERNDSGLMPLNVASDYGLPETFVWGNKYRGKTNELLTQMILNLALLQCRATPEKWTLLDPMAGRGTTLLWAARLGICGFGVEKDGNALEHFIRHCKRQCKLHRVKHRLVKGSVVKRRRDGVGQFVELDWGSATTRLITGDSTQLQELFPQRVSMLVSDLPYGVQFTGKGQRNPVNVLQQCAESWKHSLLPGGVMVLSFNALQPKRSQLMDIFTDSTFVPLPFTAPHRMSESILRDVLIFRKS